MREGLLFPPHLIHHERAAIKRVSSCPRSHSLIHREWTERVRSMLSKSNNKRMERKYRIIHYSVWSVLCNAPMDCGAARVAGIATSSVDRMIDSVDWLWAQFAHS